MKSPFLRLLLAVAANCAMCAAAQTSSPATSPASGSAPANPLPSAPSATGSPSTGTKVGVININEALFGSNEGRKEIEALQKKFEPKQTELKSQSDELDGLKKQFQTQSDKLNDEAKASLQRQIETKQKAFDRSVQDAQEDFGGQQQEIAKKILQKMAPLIVKYSQENGFGVIVDASKAWPESPVLWWGEAVDITKPIVDAYNVQSGVPAPPSTNGAAKPAPKTGTGTGTATKPATSGAAKPN